MGWGGGDQAVSGSHVRFGQGRVDVHHEDEHRHGEHGSNEEQFPMTTHGYGEALPQGSVGRRGVRMTGVCGGGWGTSAVGPPTALLPHIGHQNSTASDYTSLYPESDQTCPTSKHNVICALYK